MQDFLSKVSWPTVIVTAVILVIVLPVLMGVFRKAA